MEREINWIDAPDESALKRNYQIVRTPTNGRRLLCAVLSHRLTWVNVHFAGRTQPCTHPNCEQCDRGHVPDLKAYLIIVLQTTREKALLELTSAGAGPLWEHQQQKRSIHGLAIELGRKNDKPNGPVHCTIKGHDVPLLHYGDAPDVKPILETMWRFSPDRKATADASRARRDLARGENPIPAAGPITHESPNGSKVKGKGRTHS